MRFISVVAAALVACSSDTLTSTAQPPPDEPGSSLLITASHDVVIVIGETAEVQFALAHAPSNVHIDVGGLPLGVTADAPTFGTSFESSSVLLHAAADAPHARLEFFVRARAPGFVDSISLVTISVVAVEGSLDPTFGAGGILNLLLTGETSSPMTLGAIPGSSKMLVAFRSGSPPVVVVRLNDDGSLDTSFGDGGVARATFGGDEEPVALSVADDGRIAVGVETLISGGGDIGPSVAPAGVVTFSADGSSSTKRATSTIAPLVWSGTTLFAGKDDHVEVFDGSIATTLNFETSFASNAIMRRSDGEVIVASQGAMHGIAQTTIGWSVDPLYDAMAGGIAIAEATSGRVIAAGPWWMRRVDTTGAIDASFGSSGVCFYATNFGTPAALFSRANDGCVVVGGAYVTNSTSAITLMQFDGSGTVDTSFGVDGLTSTDLASTQGIVLGAAIDASNRLWVLTSAPPNATKIARYRLGPH